MLHDSGIGGRGPRHGFLNPVFFPDPGSGIGHAVLEFGSRIACYPSIAHLQDAIQQKVDAGLNPDLHKADGSADALSSVFCKYK